MKSKPASRSASLLILLLGAWAQVAAAQTSTGKFHGCPPEGRNGDSELNQLKNRDVPPAGYEDFTISEIRKRKPSDTIAMGRKDRANWTGDALGQVAGWEEKGARVTGRLIAIRTQGPEKCNCSSDTDVDMHLWISTKAASSEKPRSLVVEISPRLVGKHPGWTSHQFVALAKQGTRVRISGWLMWDQEHGSEVGKSRGTNWEIHPIHKIEVFEAGDWVELE